MDFAIDAVFVGSFSTYCGDPERDCQKKISESESGTDEEVDEAQLPMSAVSLSLCSRPECDATYILAQTEPTDLAHSFRS